MARYSKKVLMIQAFAVVFVMVSVIIAFIVVSRMLNINANASEMHATTYSPKKFEAPTFTTVVNSTDKANNESKDVKKTYAIKDDFELILIMGVDDRENAGETSTAINSSQADTLYLLALDHKNKTYKTLQINRDTMAKVQSYTIEGKKHEVAKMQICLAHSYGLNDQARCLNTVDAVSRLIFDIPINHYVALNMSSIAVLNDQVGGVTLTMPAGMQHAYPDFKDGETITLTGEQAERFVRVRRAMEDDHNSLRMERQELFLKSWKEQAKSKMAQEDGFALKLVLAVSKHMTSDMSANSLSELANKLNKYKDLGNTTASGHYLEANEDEGRYYREFYVDSDDLKDKVIELCYEEKTIE